MNFWSARRTVIASAALAVIAIGVIVTLHGLGRHPDASLLPGRDGSGGYPTVVGGRPVGTPSGVGASLHLAGAHPSRAPAGIGISDRASSAVAPAPPVPAQSVPVGPVPAATNLTVDVGLQPADPAALTRFDTAVSTPGSPEYRHYLAKGQFGARFGASTAVIDGLTSALTAYGLTVSPTADRLSLTVSGTAGKVEAAFNTPLVDYRLAGGRVAYLNTAAPTLPAGVAKDVMGVVGLSDVVQLQADAIPSPKAPGGMTRAPTPALRAHASGPSPCAAATADATDYGAWTSDSLASAYGFGTAYSAGDLGAGQTVALFELEPFFGLRRHRLRDVLRHLHPRHHHKRGWRARHRRRFGRVDPGHRRRRLAGAISHYPRLPGPEQRELDHRHLPPDRHRRFGQGGQHQLGVVRDGAHRLLQPGDGERRLRGDGGPGPDPGGGGGRRRVGGLLRRERSHGRPAGGVGGRRPGQPAVGDGRGRHNVDRHRSTAERGGVERRCRHRLRSRRWWQVDHVGATGVAVRHRDLWYGPPGPRPVGLGRSGVRLCHLLRR